MLGLFYPLLVAHLVGDFALQTDGMIAAKKKYGVLGVVPHVSVIAVLTLLALSPILGMAWLYALIILGTHLLIDASKIRLDAQVKSRWVSHALFLLDQLLHISILWGVATVATNAGVPNPFPTISTVTWAGTTLLVCAAFVLGILFRVFIPAQWHNRWPGALGRIAAWFTTALGFWWAAPLPVALGLGFFRWRQAELTQVMWIEAIVGGIVAILFGIWYTTLS
jgi:hypothetical protein